MTTEQIELRGGKREGAGRPKKLKTQVKDFIKEHPYAVEALMNVLYEAGIKGDRESAIYVIDRIKGKPKAITGLDEADRDLLDRATMLEFFMIQDRYRKQLQEGIDAIQITEGTERSVTEVDGEEEKGVNIRG